MLPLDENEKRFADYAKPRGWRLLKEWIEPGEDEDGPSEGFELLLLCRSSPLPDGRIFGYRLTAGNRGDLMQHEEYRQRQIEFADVCFDAALEKFLDAAA